jgi:transposase-like protein
VEERLRVVLGLLSGELSVSAAARRHGVSSHARDVAMTIGAAKCQHSSR